MRTLLVILLFAGSSLTGCSSGPCTDCPDISGIYRLTAEAADARRSTCKRMEFSGYTTMIEVQQDGSRLNLSSGEVGTLYQNLAVIFEPYGAYTNIGPGKFHLSGRMVDLDGRLGFRGTESFRLDEDGCRLVYDVSWSRHE